MLRMKGWSYRVWKLFPSILHSESMLQYGRHEATNLKGSWVRQYRRKHNYMQSLLLILYPFISWLRKAYRTKLLSVSNGSALLGPGRRVLSAAHVMVSVARTQTVLLCPCLGLCDGWQRLLSGGNEEARGEPGARVLAKPCSRPLTFGSESAKYSTIAAGPKVPADLHVTTVPRGSLC